jgi:hypothetical protein
LIDTDVPARLPDVVALPAEVDPETLPERLPGLLAAPAVLRSLEAVLRMKSPPLPRATHPTSVIGPAGAPVVVCVPGRDVVSAREPEVLAPGGGAAVDPGCCVPLCTGDCVGA